MRRVTAARNARPCSARPCRRHRRRRAGTRRLCGADASRCEERVLGGAPTLPLQARTRAHARTHACTHARTGRQTHTGNVLHADAHSRAHGHACTCHTHAHAYAPSHYVKHATGARTRTLARTHRRLARAGDGNDIAEGQRSAARCAGAHGTVRGGRARPHAHVLAPTCTLALTHAHARTHARTHACPRAHARAHTPARRRTHTSTRAHARTSSGARRCT